MSQLTVTQFATPIALGQRGTMRAADVTKAGPVVPDQSIPLGCALAMDPTESFGVSLPFSGFIFAGVAYNAGTLEYNLQNNPSAPVYTQGSVVPYIARGSVGVVCEDDVTSGSDPVYVRITTAGPLLAGNFATSAHTADCVLLPNAKWLTSGDAGTVVQLEVNAP